MNRAAARRRAVSLRNFGYVRKRDADLAVALSAMRVWEARGLLAKSRELLRRLAPLTRA